MIRKILFLTIGIHNILLITNELIELIYQLLSIMKPENYNQKS